MSGRLRFFLDRYSLPLLLSLGFCLQGAKTPITFFVWATGVLGIILGLHLTQPGSRIHFSLHKDLLILFLIFLSYFASRDHSISLFGTTQLLLYWTLWVAMKQYPALRDSTGGFWRVSAVLGMVSVLQTLLQWKQGHWDIAYGFLPVNRIFNAMWLTCLSLGLFARYQATEPSKRTWGYRFELLSACLMAFLVIFGPTRNALMTLGLGGLYLSYRRLTPRLLWIGIMVVTIIIGFMLHRDMISRWRVNDVEGRRPIWGIALKATAERPLTGFGIGSFEMLFHRYAFPIETDPIRFDRTTQFAHNEYLQIASELGVVPALLIVGSVLWLLAKPPRRPQTRAAYAAFLAMSVCAMTNIVWHMPLLVFLTLVWGSMLWQDRQPEAPPLSPMLHHTYWKWCGRLGGGALWILLATLAVRDSWAQNKQWEVITRYQPWDAEAWHQRGLQQREPNISIPFHARAVELSPHQFYFRESLGRSLEASETPDYLPRAIEQYQTALSLAPGRALNALALGRIHYRMGDFNNSLPWFEMARQIEPRYWEASLWIARCHFALGQKQQAIFLLKNLKTQHEQYLLLKTHPFNDWVTPVSPSPYGQHILSYDDSVIAQQLAEWRS